MKKLLVVSGLVLAVFIVAISETSAQTISSCYNTKSGAMRYVTGPDKCKKTETQISWNTTGPKGDPGPQGIQGAAGVVNGVQQVVYGTVSLSHDDTLPANAGWSWAYVSTGPQSGWHIETRGIIYDADGGGAFIQFDVQWSTLPTCVVTAHWLNAVALSSWIQQLGPEFRWDGGGIWTPTQYYEWEPHGLMFIRSILVVTGMKGDLPVVESVPNAFSFVCFQ
jgi:hypothetical protein